ncbi:hypothetical protein GCM10028792_24670 [Salinisphaera aquimarina]
MIGLGIVTAAAAAIGVGADMSLMVGARQRHGQMDTTARTADCFLESRLGFVPCHGLGTQQAFDHEPAEAKQKQQSEQSRHG